MDSATNKECFRLLDLPAEIRDMIYEHVLFGSAHDTDASQRAASLDDGIEIQTNILLTSRQVRREARNTIFRAQMVEITSHGGKLEEMCRRAVVEDGIPLYHPKDKYFCLLKHTMDESYHSESWYEHDDACYLVRRQDISRLCRGLFTPDPAPSGTPTLDPSISHVLTLVDPVARLLPSPLSMTIPTNKLLMQTYERVLRGCQDFWMDAHSSVEPDERFMKDMVEHIKSGNPPRSDSSNRRIII